MHQLHFLLCQADSAEEAGGVMEESICNWGNENNWRTIGGISNLTEDDQLNYYDYDARWGLSYLLKKREETESLLDTAFSLCKKECFDLINNSLYGDFEQTCDKSLLEYNRLITSKYKEQSVSNYVFEVLEEQAKAMQDVIQIRNERFPSPWEFERLGITNLNIDYPSKDPNSFYIGLLDMHY